MKVVSVDTEKHIGFSCPHSKETVEFYPDHDSDLSNPDVLVDKTFIKGIIIPEVGGEMEHGCEPYISKWNEAWSKEDEKKDEEGEFLFLDEFMETYSDEDLMAVEVTTTGFACGPVQFTIYYIVKETDWNLVEFVS